MTCTESASLIAAGLGSARISPLELTATNVEVNVMFRGSDVDSKASIEDCDSAGKSGRF